MNTFVWTVRVRADAQRAVTVHARNHAFSVGDPLSFRATDSHPSAIELMLGAFAADLTATFRTLASKQRLHLDALEFSASGPWDSLGLCGNASAPMTLRDCAIPVDRAFCKPGKGFDFMLGVVLTVFQLGNAAISVGICEAAVQATTQHLTGKRFEHLGSRLADLPNQRARLARMRIETDQRRRIRNWCNDCSKR